MGRPERTVGICLVAATVALLLVGLFSGTPLRHLIQVLPLTVALGLLWRRVQWAPYAALPLFGIWFIIMLLIWLWLLGLARVLTGNFSPAETLLTVVIGLGSLFGLWTVVRSRFRAPIAWRLAAFLAFAVLQIGALWLSLQPFAARR